MASTASRHLPRRRPVTCKRRISNHLAASLVVFAMLQIFIVAMRGGSLAAHLGIVLLISVCVPLARRCERQWEAIPDADLHQPDVAARLRHDIRMIWACALALPFIWVLIV